MVFFPDTPDLIFDLMDTSKSKYLLGKRVEGKGGNGGLHRYFNRLQTDKITRTSKRKLFQLFTEMSMIHPILRSSNRLSGYGNDFQTVGAWQALIMGARLDDIIPRTANLVRQFDFSSRSIVSMFNEQNHDAAIDSLHRLPWSHAETVEWYIGECELRPHNATLACFPVQLLSLLLILKAISEEQRISGDVRPGILTPLLSTRDSSTGDLAAIRVWLDQVQQALGSPSQDAVFKLILRDYGADDENRIRQGRRFRSGTEVPSPERLKKMLTNIRKELSEEDYISCEISGNFACFFQKALLKNKLIAKSFSNFDPLMPFDDWTVVANFKIDTMLPPGGLPDGRLARS